MSAKSHNTASVTQRLQLLWGIKDTARIPATPRSISLPAGRATLPRVPSGGREGIRGTKCKAQKTYFIIPSLAHTWWETLKGVNIFNTVCVYIKNVIYTNLPLLRCINVLHGLELVHHAFQGETEEGHWGLKNLLLCFPCPKWLEEKKKKKWMCFWVMKKHTFSILGTFWSDKWEKQSKKQKIPNDYKWKNLRDFSPIGDKLGEPPAISLSLQTAVAPRGPAVPQCGGLDLGWIHPSHPAGIREQWHIPLQPPLLTVVLRGFLGSSCWPLSLGDCCWAAETNPHTLVTCSPQVHFCEGVPSWQRAGASPDRSPPVRAPPVGSRWSLLVTRLTETSWVQSHIKSSRPSISGTLQVPWVSPILLNLCCTYAALVCLPE